MNQESSRGTDSGLACLPQIGITIRSTTLCRFWTMLANTHGQIWNASEFARPFGVADTTVRNYLDLMTSALVIRHLAARVDECFFWASHGGAELDLLVVRGQGRMGFEIKRTTSPQVTPSMRSALSDLHLRSLDVIHAGETTFPMDKKIRAVAFSRLLDDIKPLR